MDWAPCVIGQSSRHRDGAPGEPDPGLRQTITSISDLTDFQGKMGGPSLIRLSHNDVRNEDIFLAPSIFKRDDGY